jgi:small-conductance mechanosensitive channel
MYEAVILASLVVSALLVVLYIATGLGLTGRQLVVAAVLGVVVAIVAVVVTLLLVSPTLGQYAWVYDEPASLALMLVWGVEAVLAATLVSGFIRRWRVLNERIERIATS